MKQVNDIRHEEYFNSAAEVARQATCFRAKCGSVVVSPSGNIIGRGFNAPPLGHEDQRMCHANYNMSIKPKSDKTCCVHAEWNAILDAAVNYGSQLAGSTLYFMRVDELDLFTNAGEPYCTVCSRLALQSGITVFGLWENGPRMIDSAEYNKKSYAYYA